MITKGLDSENKKNSMKTIFFKYTLVPIIPLVIIATLATDPQLWINHGHDHFYIEMISVMLSFIVAYYFIMRAYALKDKLSLFIGLGFHIGGIIDLLHGVFAILNFGDVIFEGYFIPQTWVAGRIVMGLVLMIAIVKFADPKKRSVITIKSIKKSIIFYTLALGGLGGIITAWSLSYPFPYLIIDFLIQRPYEIPSAVFFSIALIYFYKHKVFNIPDPLYKGIAIALIVDIFVNLIISYSSTVFDSAFNFAHLLKNVSYFIIIMALASSTIQHFKSQKNDNKIISYKQKELQIVNEKLVTSELKYRSLYENSPDLYRTINTDGIILNCNESYVKSLGYTKEEVIGKSIFEHVIPGEKKAMCDSFETWKSTGRVLNRNVIFKRKDGSSFPVVVSASNLYDENGKLIGSNTIIRDMSELRDAEKRIEYEKLKRLSTIGELTARVSHDLLNPLTVIKNTLFSLQLKPKLDEETKREYQRLERAVIRMTHQIEDVLDYVKTKPLKLKTNSLLEILQLSLQRIRVPSDIKITIPKNDVKIFSDSEKLEVVFVNLIGNAIQAMNKGNIDIRFTEEDKFILIEVEDSGLGIPKELLPKIFDPLFTTREVGTGLGLVSCKNIIKKHNGTIEVDTVIGTGTTFKIRLPKVLKEIVQK